MREPSASTSRTAFPKRAPGASLRRPEGGHGVPGSSGARSGEADGEATPEHDACPEAALAVSTTAGRWIFRRTSRRSFRPNAPNRRSLTKKIGQSEARMGLPPFITAEGCWQAGPAPPQPSARAERTSAGVACPDGWSFTPCGSDGRHETRRFNNERRGDSSFRRVGGGRLVNDRSSFPTRALARAVRGVLLFQSPKATHSHRKSRARDSAVPAGRRVRGFSRGSGSAFAWPAGVGGFSRRGRGRVSCVGFS